MFMKNGAVFAVGENQFKQNHRRLPALGLLLGAAFASVPAFADDATSEASRYKLGYVQDTLGSSMIRVGDFNAAQEQLEAGLSLHVPYERYTNLCVTLISLQNYEEAGASCRAAVRHSKPAPGGLQARSFGISERRAHKNRKALALSNLGVLQALQGQYEMARESLRKSTARYLQRGEVGQYNLSILAERESQAGPATLARAVDGV